MKSIILFCLLGLSRSLFTQYYIGNEGRLDIQLATEKLDSVLIYNYSTDSILYLSGKWKYSYFIGEQSDSVIQYNYSYDSLALEALQRKLTYVYRKDGKIRSYHHYKFDSTGTMKLNDYQLNSYDSDGKQIERTIYYWTDSLQLAKPSGKFINDYDSLQTFYYRWIDSISAWILQYQVDYLESPYYEYETFQDGTDTSFTYYLGSYFEKEDIVYPSDSSRVYSRKKYRRTLETDPWIESLSLIKEFDEYGNLTRDVEIRSGTVIYDYNFEYDLNSESNSSLFPEEIRRSKLGVNNLILTSRVSHGEFRLIEFHYSDFLNSSLNVHSEEMEKWSLFPNPANEIIKVLGSKESQSYEVYDMTGKKCIEGIIGIENAQIEIGILQSGVYILKIGKETFKFIKN